jgi:RNA polymerase sigma-70 factor (ECF subfamily)
MKQQNPRQSFIDLYTSESDKVFRYCFLRVSNRDQAVDITQDAFTKLWDQIARGVEINNLRSFLFKIAHNLIIDWYRKKKATSLDVMLEPEDDMVRLQVVDDTQIDLDVGTEGRMLIEKIGLLDNTYQHVVYLRFVEDLSPKEIAEIVKLDVNVVSVRINRGVNELRKMLHINEEANI